MKKVLVFAFLLSACNPKQSPIVSSPRVPDLPANLAIAATNLPLISDTTMGTAHIQGVKDDMQYNALRDRYNNLLSLYNCIKESINKRKEVKCL